MTIALVASRDATVSGLVEDENGRAVEGATVQVLGGESGKTSADGGFTLKTNAAVGQTVRLHAEKPGYQAVDQDHLAGREPVTIVMARARARGLDLTGPLSHVHVAAAGWFFSSNGLTYPPGSTRSGSGLTLRYPAASDVTGLRLA